MGFREDLILKAIGMEDWRPLSGKLCRYTEKRPGDEENPLVVGEREEWERKKEIF